jgi:hypothetical protein
MVVAEIVDGCGILAATVGGSSLKRYVAHRWPHRDYLRHSRGRVRWPDRWWLRHSCGNHRLRLR